MRSRFFVTIALVLALMLVTVAASAAQQSPSRATSSRASVKPYCVQIIGLDPTGAEQNPAFVAHAVAVTGHVPTFLKVTDERCFSTRAAARGFAGQNGRIAPDTALSPQSGNGTCNSPDVSECGYDFTNYRAGLFQSFPYPFTTTCAPGGYATAWVGSSYNDIVSSFATTVCTNTVLYTDINFGGSSYSCGQNCPTLPYWMDNQMSSYWGY